MVTMKWIALIVYEWEEKETERHGKVKGERNNSIRLNAGWNYYYKSIHIIVTAHKRLLSSSSLSWWYCCSMKARIKHINAIPSTNGRHMCVLQKAKIELCCCWSDTLPKTKSLILLFGCVAFLVSEANDTRTHTNTYSRNKFVQLFIHLGEKELTRRRELDSYGIVSQIVVVVDLWCISFIWTLDMMFFKQFVQTHRANILWSICFEMCNEKKWRNSTKKRRKTKTFIHSHILHTPIYRAESWKPHGHHIIMMSVMATEQWTYTIWNNSHPNRNGSVVLDGLFNWKYTRAFKFVFFLLARLLMVIFNHRRFATYFFLYLCVYGCTHVRTQSSMEVNKNISTKRCIIYHRERRATADHKQHVKERSEVLVLVVSDTHAHILDRCTSHIMLWWVYSCCCCMVLYGIVYVYDTYSSS